VPKKLAEQETVSIGNYIWPNMHNSTGRIH